MKFLFLLLLAIPLHAQAIEEDAARAAAQEFAQSRLADLRAHFTPELRAVVSPVRLLLLQRGKLGPAGTYFSTKEPDCFPFREYRRCSVMLDFSERSDLITMTFDGGGRIAGLLNYGIAGPNPAHVSAAAWFLFLSPLSMMLILVVVFHFWPVVRHDFLAGSDRGPAFVASPESRALRKRYNRWNVALALTGALVLMAAALTNHAVPAILQYVGQPFVHGIVLTLVVLDRRRFGPASAGSEAVRTAELTPLEPLPRWMWPLWALPAILLAMVTAYLVAHWDVIRAETAIQLGAEVQADRWDTKTFKSVFGPLVIGWSGLLVWYTHTLLVIWGARRNTITMRLFRANVASMLLAQFAVLLPVAVISLNAEAIVGSVAVPLLALLPLIGALVATIPKRRASKMLPRENSAREECWRAGMFYVNPDDPAWVVNDGGAFSPNYGHRWILVLAILLCVQMLAAFIWLAV